MPKLIFTSRYMKKAPAPKLKHLISYIATREGVEKSSNSNLLLPATEKQQSIVKDLLKDIPHSRSMLEYKDFIQSPTIGNAADFISTALEQNIDLVAKRKNYVEYIAGRPRVERIGEHGLFTDSGTPVVLSRVQDQISSHNGTVWTHVVSLRREDAQRLGYDSVDAWQNLLRSKRAMFCEHMKIVSENLKWYAAFHNESHHPHVHIIVYSEKENEGYLSKAGIDAMRSELVHDIFRQDFENIYAGQNAARKELKDAAEKVLVELFSGLANAPDVNSEIEKDLLLLAKRLQNTKGKKVYGYLKADVKDIIDRIVDELAKDKRIDSLYRAWSEWQNQIVKAYMNSPPPLPPLSKHPQFKNIKNMVIAEALKMGSHHFNLAETEKDKQGKCTEEANASPENISSVPGSLPYSENPCEIPFDKVDGNFSANVPMAVLRLLRGVENAIKDDFVKRGSGNSVNHIDRKRWKKLKEKKKDQGHAPDDHESPQQNY